MNELLNKLCYIHTGILLSNIKEWAIDVCSNLDLKGSMLNNKSQSQVVIHAWSYSYTFVKCQNYSNGE